MEANNFANRVAYNDPKAELKKKGRTLAGIWLFWFVLLNLFNLGGETSIWRLAKDALTASQAFYLPYRIGSSLTGTPTGGAAISLVILIWMSTWIGDHELLGWIVIVGGYVIDFGPCIYKLMTAYK